jgi:hypothetical protein
MLTFENVCTNLPPYVNQLILTDIKSNEFRASKMAERQLRLAGQRNAGHRE